MQNKPGDKSQKRSDIGDRERNPRSYTGDQPRGGQGMGGSQGGMGGERRDRPEGKQGQSRPRRDEDEE